MKFLLYMALFLVSAEIITRVLLMLYYRNFRMRSFWKSFSNPPGGMDWRVFAGFGEVEDKLVGNLFRFSTQSQYMGLTDEQMVSIMAKANQTDQETVRRIYTGSWAFERSSYRPFVGFSTKPNQDLSYVKINDMGFQSSSSWTRKAPNTKRVLILGGSVAYGIGCTGVDLNLTSQLQALLNEKQKNIDPEVRWEVINLAFVASQSISQMNQLLIYGKLFSPDYVVELSGFNDLYFFLNKKPKMFTYHFQDLVIQYLSSSFWSKILNELSKCSFLVRTLIVCSKSELQKNEGQLYTVW